MECCSFAMSGGTSSPPNSAMSTYLDDWALAQDGPTRYDNMLGSPEATSSGSAASLQWPGGSPSDVFAQLQEELDIEHATITMEDQSPASCQAGAAERTEQVFISPECLSRLPSAVPFTPCALQVPNLVANSLQPSQPLDSTANVPAATPYFSPSTSSSTASPAPQPTETQDAAAHPQPRRGRGRAKLPEDKLKKTQRRQTLPERCPYCVKGFEWKKDLKRHLRSHHQPLALQEGYLSEEDVQRKACPYCEQTFARGDYLGRHLRSKHGGMAR